MNDTVSEHEGAVAIVLDAIERVAPDVDARQLPRDVDIRVEADLDSMDFLAVVTTIADRTGTEIPERDYGQVRSIDDLVDYLSARTGPGASD